MVCNFFRSGFFEILQFLISNAQKLNLDINERDSSGENALFYALRSNHNDSFIYLLDNGEFNDVSALILQINYTPNYEFFSGIELSCNNHGVSVLAQSLLEEKHDFANAILKCKQDVGGKTNQIKCLFRNHGVLRKR